MDNKGIKPPHSFLDVYPQARVPLRLLLYISTSTFLFDLVLSNVNGDGTFLSQKLVRANDDNPWSIDNLAWQRPAFHSRTIKNFQSDGHHDIENLKIWLGRDIFFLPKGTTTKLFLHLVNVKGLVISHVKSHLQVNSCASNSQAIPTSEKAYLDNRRRNKYYYLVIACSVHKGAYVRWVDYGADAYSAASVRASPYTIPRVGACNDLYVGQVMLPLCHTIENEEFLEVARLQSHGFNQENVITRDMFLLQLCRGMDENSVNSCAQLVFVPIDEAFADDVHLLPSGFHVIPLESKMDLPTGSRTLDLASALEVGTGATSGAANKNTSHTYNFRYVLTIAFQFTYEDHLRENVAAMARDYVRNIIISVQKVALAILPSQICNSRLGEKVM